MTVWIMRAVGALVIGLLWESHRPFNMVMIAVLFYLLGRFEEAVDACKVLAILSKRLDVLEERRDA